MRTALSAIVQRLRDARNLPWRSIGAFLGLLAVGVALAVASIVLIAAGGNDPTTVSDAVQAPTATPKPSPSPTPTLTPSQAPTRSPAPEPPPLRAPPPTPAPVPPTPPPSPAALPTPPPAAPQSSGTIWRPALNTSWQWHLSGTLDTSVDVDMYNIDVFDTAASVVASLHARGRKVVCYVSAGSWEEWRPDADRFPASVKGRSNGWPGEKWLDIRRLDILGPIMEARMDLCAQKGFDGVEFDNVDGYDANTGFPLTYQDQLTYNKWLAGAAHARGLSAGLKNDVDQVLDLLPFFDWALSEECFSYDECNALLPFVQAGKAVFVVEYDLSTSEFCPQANAMNLNAMRKHLDLDAYREPCR